MKIRNLLPTLVLAASISVPMLVTNTANASDHHYNNSRSDYRHGYRDGYRNSSDDQRYYRRQGHGYSNYGYAPHVGVAIGYSGGHGGGYGGGHGYSRGHGGGYGGGHSSLGFLFNF